MVVDDFGNEKVGVNSFLKSEPTKFKKVEIKSEEDFADYMKHFRKNNIFDRANRENDFSIMSSKNLVDFIKENKDHLITDLIDYQHLVTDESIIERMGILRNLIEEL